MKTKTRLRFADLPRDYAGLCALLLPRTIHDAVDYANTTEVTNCYELFCGRKSGRSAVVEILRFRPCSHRTLCPNSRALVVRLRRGWPFGGSFNRRSGRTTLAS